eukprot:g2260.t1
MFHPNSEWEEPIPCEGSFQGPLTLWEMNMPPLIPVVKTSNPPSSTTEKDESESDESKLPPRIETNNKGKDQTPKKQFPVRRVVLTDIFNEEFRCPICMELMKDPVVVRKCMHRFCNACIQKYLRSGLDTKECPTCRIPVGSRRMLQKDENFNALIHAIFPDPEKFEAEQMKVIIKINREQSMNAAFQASQRRKAEFQKQTSKKRKLRASFLSSSGSSNSSNSQNHDKSTRHRNGHGNSSINSGRGRKSNGKNNLSTDENTNNNLNGSDMGQPSDALSETYQASDLQSSCTEIEFLFLPHESERVLPKTEAQYLRTSRMTTIQQLKKCMYTLLEKDASSLGGDVRLAPQHAAIIKAEFPELVSSKTASTKQTRGGNKSKLTKASCDDHDKGTNTTTMNPYHSDGGVHKEGKNGEKKNNRIDSGAIDKVANVLNSTALIANKFVETKWKVSFRDSKGHETYLLDSMTMHDVIQLVLERDDRFRHSAASNAGLTNLHIDQFLTLYYRQEL